MSSQEQPQGYEKERCGWCGSDALKSSKHCSEGHKKLYARWDRLSDEEKKDLVVKDPKDDDKTAKAKRDIIKRKLAEGLEGKHLKKIKKQ